MTRDTDWRVELVDAFYTDLQALVHHRAGEVVDVHDALDIIVPDPLDRGQLLLAYIGVDVQRRRTSDAALPGQYL